MYSMVALRWGDARVVFVLLVVFWCAGQDMASGAGRKSAKEAKSSAKQAVEFLDQIGLTKLSNLSEATCAEVLTSGIHDPDFRHSLLGVYSVLLSKDYPAADPANGVPALSPIAAKLLPMVETTLVEADAQSAFNVLAGKILNRRLDIAVRSEAFFRLHSQPWSNWQGEAKRALLMQLLQEPILQSHAAALIVSMPTAMADLTEAEKSNLVEASLAGTANAESVANDSRYKLFSAGFLSQEKYRGWLLSQARLKTNMLATRRECLEVARTVAKVSDDDITVIEQEIVDDTERYARFLTKLIRDQSRPMHQRIRNLEQLAELGVVPPDDIRQLKEMLERERQ